MAGDQFSRALSGRHIQFIALGGAIGASLFLGSGAAIHRVGPAILIAYGLAGAAVYLMARALGAMILADPETASFNLAIQRHLGDWAGFVTGWSYWLIWVLVSVFELTGTGLLVRYWLPVCPVWLPGLVAIAVLYAVNRLAVRLFAELEFWLTLVKVLTILVLIVGGGAMAIFHLGPSGHEAAVAKLWSHGGLSSVKVSDVLAVLPLAIFAFGGTELIGVTAAEATDPARSIPRAINGIIGRIFLFYVGSLAVIMMIVDWRSLDPAVSPFVLVFERAGFAAAAGVVNLVVLTAVLSSINSGIFATGRMLATLAHQGDAPATFAKLDARHLPSRGITISTLAMVIGLGFNYVAPEAVFGFVMSLIAALLLFTWTMIVLSHDRARRAAGTSYRSLFAMPLFPYSSRLVLAFFAGIACLMLRDPETRPTIASFALWLAAVSLAFSVRQRANRR